MSEKYQWHPWPEEEPEEHETISGHLQSDLVLVWNLGDGLENVCNSVMRKLDHAGYVLEERNRTIINLDSYEVTAMIWAMNEYIHSDRFAEWVRTGGTK